MSGNLFTETVPITLEEWVQFKPCLFDILKKEGINVECVLGSLAFPFAQNNSFGDIDLAVSYSDGIDSLISRLEESFDVKKVGGSVASFKCPIDKRWVQVDLMLGNPKYLAWSRGSTYEKNIKGAARNLLLIIAFRFISELKLSHNDVERQRYAIDFDNGLFIAKQTKISKDGTKANVNWRDLDKKLLTDDPQAISDTFFDGRKLKTFSDVVTAINHSSTLSGKTKDVFDAFLMELKSSRRSSSYGDIDSIKSCLHK